MASLAFLRVASGGLVVAAVGIGGADRSPMIELAAFGLFIGAMAFASALANRERRRRAEAARTQAEIRAKLGMVVGDEADEALPRPALDRALAGDLRNAIELDELRLAFQPVVALDSGRIGGLEALVRWEHPDRGPLTPSAFLDIAELDGTILPIGRWVLRRACEQVAVWKAAGAVPRDLFVCVNVSGREVRSPGFLGAVEEALAWSAMQPSHLVLEVSETALGGRAADISEVLEAVRALGVRVAIDDVGTGSLALRHLGSFPLDALKIAGQLAVAPDRDPGGAALAHAIVAAGAAMGIATVAERIETEEHAQRMRDLGCTYGQGYFFAPPLTVAEIDAGVEGLATDHRWRAELPAPAPAVRPPQPRLLEPIRQATAA